MATRYTSNQNARKGLVDNTYNIEYEVTVPRNGFTGCVVFLMLVASFAAVAIFAFGG